MCHTKYWIVTTSFVTLASFFLGNCANDEATGPTGPVRDTVTRYTAVAILVADALDSQAIANANVVLYNADNNEPVTRTTSSTTGECFFMVDSGNYYVRISAQEYGELPPNNNTPFPFSAIHHDTTTRTYYLTPLQATSGTLGMVMGNVYTHLADTDSAAMGVLVIAENVADTGRFPAVSGPDGFFIIYNLPFGSYRVLAYRAGVQIDSTPTVFISQSAPNDTAIIFLSQITGGSLSGSITFLAGTPGVVDVSLLDPQSRSAIPGLSTMMGEDTIGPDYSIQDIPGGTYLAWASFKNDGYVMDPDRLFKFGLPLITFNSDSSQTLDFDVTGAIYIVSPTNPADSVYPVVADSLVPLFTWTKQSAYASVKEFVLEVSDINGNVIWGGFTPNGTVNHRQLLTNDARLSDSLYGAWFNFDSSATAALVSGSVYHWKVYADDDAQSGVQTLLSSSEDLRGLFKAP